jgi:hypothetical protein
LASEPPVPDSDKSLSGPLYEEIGMKLVFLLVVIVIVGVCLGWFHFSSSSDTGRPNVTMSVDKDKIETDKDKAVEEVRGLGHKSTDKTAVTTQGAQD